jgi:octaprenyl-diphosphate synthase
MSMPDHFQASEKKLNPRHLIDPNPEVIRQKRESIDALFKQDLLHLNLNIQNNLNSSVDLVNQICQYIIQAGGKRLRPMILILMHHHFYVQKHPLIQTPSTSKTSLDFKSPVYTLAAVVEFIHTATLLHDDVVDESSLRRNRATANAEFGNAASVLVGDFLYSRAFQMMVGVNSLAVMDVLSNATNTIAQGEVQQLINIRDVEIDVENYMQVLYAKTAKLFEASAELAVLLACESALFDQSELQTHLNAARAYGRYLGCAFQLMDDYLDYAADQQTLGKTIGDDLREGKMTLPLIYLYQASNHKALIKEVILDQKTSAFETLIKVVKNSQALKDTQEKAINQAQKAKLAIAYLPNSSYKQSLLDICDLAVFRSF